LIAIEAESDEKERSGELFNDVPLPKDAGVAAAKPAAAGA